MNIKMEHDFNKSCRFIENLVEAMQEYGVSSGSMVSTVSNVTHALGLKGEILASPNFVQTVLWREDNEQQKVRLTRLRSGNYDLGKLSLVSKLVKSAESGEISPEEGLVELDRIRHSSNPYKPYLTAVAFIMSGIAFGIIVGSSWINILTGGIVAVVSFAVSYLSSRSSALAAIQEAVAAMLCVILGNIAALFLPGINPLAVTVFAVIVFVPGFGLTIAPSELISGNVLSGIIWFTNAILTALKLLGGAAIGSAIARSTGIYHEPLITGVDIPVYMTWVAAPLLIVSLAITMKLNPGKFIIIILGGWLVWGAIQIGNILGFWQGTFFGTIILMIYANWYSRKFQIPSSMIILPCVMILVPGLAALRALYNFNAEGFIPGLKAGYNVLILRVSIIGGSFIGEAVSIQNIFKTGKTVKSLLLKN